MDAVVGLLLFGWFLGLGLLLFGLLGMKKEKPAAIPMPALAPSFEADEAINELTSMSKEIFEELDGKYQELLFLYNLIDSKKAPDTTVPGVDVKISDEAVLPAKFDLKVDNSTKTMFKNPKLRRIMELYAQGLSEGDIAKEMNIGQGELKIILDLNSRFGVR